MAAMIWDSSTQAWVESSPKVHSGGGVFSDSVGMSYDDTAQAWKEDWPGEPVALVPTMTSNTTPSGVASASEDQNGARPAYYAFDDNTSCSWGTSANVTSGWISYKFPSAKCVKSVVYNTYLIDREEHYLATTVKIQASNDGSSWTDLGQFLSNAAYNTNEITTTISNTSYYLYYRLYFANHNYDSSSKGGAKSIVVNKIQYYGW